VFSNNDKVTTEWLRGVSFFAGFSDGELEAVSKLGERRSLETGTVVIEQGRVGDACYVVVSGTAVVSIRGEYVTTVGPGTMIGEMALVEHRPRNATVVADGPLELVSFGTDEFRKLLARSPNTQERVTNLLIRRLNENEHRDS